jgi:hypothetical protein
MIQAPGRIPVIGITADSSACEQTGFKTNREGLYSLAIRYCDAIENAGGYSAFPIASSDSPSVEARRRAAD